MIHNSKEEIRERKMRDNLRIVGKGIIILNIWILLKSFGVFFFEREEILYFLKERVNADDFSSDRRLLMLFVLVMGVYLLVGIIFGFYVGASAIREGHGKKGLFGFRFITVILLFNNCNSILQGLEMLSKGQSFLDTNLTITVSMSRAMLFVDITAVIMLVDLLISDVRIRMYKHQEAKELKSLIAKEA